jgi:hypothetical protein
MAGVLQHLRSSTLNKRPNPASMVDGQVAINYASGAPGMFFKDSNGALVKVGPVHVGSGAPNAVPASGGTAGNSIGEQWLDTSSGTYVFKIWDGSAWRSEAGEFVNTTGDTMTGALGIVTGSASTPGLFFSGDANSGLYSPGADQVAISTGGTGRLFINSSGYTSIGNSSPQALVHFGAGTSAPAFGTASNLVYVCTAGQTEVQLRTTVNDVTGSIYTDSNGVNIRAASAHPLSFLTSNTERLRITAAGLVGIGTSAVDASSRLHVKGQQALFESASGGSGFVLKGTDSSGNPWRVGHLDTVQSLQFSCNNALSQMTLDSSGRLGIGTSTPYARMHSVQSATGEGLRIDGSGSGFALVVEGGTTYNTKARQVSIGSSYFSNTPPANGLIVEGNAGIGTSSPQHKLVVSNGGVQNIEFNWDGASTNFIQSYNRSTSQYLPLSFYSSQHIFFNGTNNSESGRFDSSGRLLIGTSTVTTTASTATNNLIALESTNNYSGVSFTANCNDSNGSYLVLKKSRGTSPGSTTVVQSGDEIGNIFFEGTDGSASRSAAAIRAFVDATPGASDMPGRLVFSTTADGASSPTERMRISRGGSAGFFCDTSFDVMNLASSETAGSARWFIYATYGASAINTGTQSFGVYTNGNVVNTNNSYGSLSDIKLKENIVDANSQWNDLKALQVRNYNFKEGQTHTQIGLIAQEVELVSPGLVSESPDRDAEGNDLGTVTKSVNYSVLYMKAVKALQEAMERIEVLEQRLADAGIA